MLYRPGLTTGGFGLSGLARVLAVVNHQSGEPWGGIRGCCRCTRIEPHAPRRQQLRAVFSLKIPTLLALILLDEGHIPAINEVGAAPRSLSGNCRCHFGMYERTKECGWLGVGGLQNSPARHRLMLPARLLQIGHQGTEILLIRPRGERRAATQRHTHSKQAKKPLHRHLSLVEHLNTYHSG